MPILNSENPDCKVCTVYPQQDGKEICIKCEGMGFIVGDKEGNDKIRVAYMAEFNKLVNKLFPNSD